MSAESESRTPERLASLPLETHRPADGDEAPPLSPHLRGRVGVVTLVYALAITPVIGLLGVFSPGDRLAVRAARSRRRCRGRTPLIAVLFETQEPVGTITIGQGRERQDASLFVVGSVGFRLCPWWRAIASGHSAQHGVIANGAADHLVADRSRRLHARRPAPRALQRGRDSADGQLLAGLRRTHRRASRRAPRDSLRSQRMARPLRPSLGSRRL